jgi:hypothetical protein
MNCPRHYVDMLSSATSPNSRPPPPHGLQRWPWWSDVVVTALSSRHQVARDDHQRHRAAVAVARPAAAAQEAKEVYGDRGIAAFVTAVLTQLARIPMRGAHAGAALAALNRERGHWRRMPVWRDRQVVCSGPWRRRRGWLVVGGVVVMLVHSSTLL